MDSCRLSLLHIAVAFAIPCSAFTGSDNPGAEKSKLETNELLQTIVAGSEHNYGQLKTLKARFELQIDSLWVEKNLLGVTIKGKGKLADDFPPHFSIKGAWILRGADLSYSCDSEDGKDAKERILSVNGVTTRYNANAKGAWINSSSQAVPHFGLDPRQLGLMSDSRSLSRVLLEGQVIKVTYPLKQDDMSNIVQVTLKDKNERRILFDFSPDTSFLPTRIVYYYDKEDLYPNVVTRIKYRELLSGSAWFPEYAKNEIFLRPASGKTDHGECTTVSSITVIGAIEVNGAIDDRAFALDFPKGTVVHDNINKTRIKTGEQSITLQEPSYLSWELRWSALVLLVLLAGLCALLLHKQRGLSGVKRIQ